MFVVNYLLVFKFILRQNSEHMTWEDSSFLPGRSECSTRGGGPGGGGVKDGQWAGSRSYMYSSDSNVEAWEKKRKPTQMILSASSSNKIQTFQNNHKMLSAQTAAVPREGGGGAGTHSLAGKRREVICTLHCTVCKCVRSCRNNGISDVRKPKLEHKNIFCELFTSL